MRRTAVAVVAGLVLVACGSSADDDASSEPAATPAPADTPAATEAPTPEPAATEPATPEPAASEPAASEPAATEPAATEPAATDAPAPEPAPVGGRQLAEALAPASDIESNPLPDLVVDDVSRGAAVNLRNVFPAERPVLIWMWAPH